MFRLGNRAIDIESISILIYLVVFLNVDWYNMNAITNNGPLLICMGFLLVRMLRSQFRLYQYQIYIILYMIVTGLSVLYSVDSSTSIYYFRDVITNSSILLLFFAYCREGKEKIIKLMNMYIFAATVTAIYIVLKIGVATILSQGINIKVLGDGWNANSIAIRLAIGMVFIGYLFCMERERFRRRKLLYLVSVIAASFTIIFSGSRTGLMMLVGILFTVVFTLNNKRMIKAMIISFGLIAVAYYLIMNVETLYNIIGYRVRNLLLFTRHEEVNEGSVYIRQALIQKGIDWFMQRPLFGYGLGTFSYLNGGGYYSHNTYVELLVGGGLVGLIVFFMPLLHIVKSVLQHWKTAEGKHLLLNSMLLFLTGYSSVACYELYFMIGINILYCLATDHVYESSTV